jgi:hypothetical protein
VAFEGIAASEEMLLTVICYSMTIKKHTEGICDRNDLQGEQIK